MTQIIKLRQIPTPVVDITYVNVTYPGLFVDGEVTVNYNPFFLTDSFLLTGDEQDTNEITFYPTFYYLQDADNLPSSLGSNTMNARGF